MMSIWSWLGEALGFVARKAAKEAARRAAEAAVDAVQRHADSPAPFKPLDVGEPVRRVDLTRKRPRGFADPEAPTDPDRTPVDTHPPPANRRRQ